MSYTKTTWANEVPDSSPVKYEIVDDVLGEVAGSATISLVTSVTAGTPVNATNLNHLEDGVEAAAAVADNAHADAAAAQADATQALADAADAQTDATQALADAAAALAAAEKPVNIAFWDFGGSEFTTTSSTGVDITSLTLTLTLTKVSKIICLFGGDVGSGAAGVYPRLFCNIDGVDYTGLSGCEGRGPENSHAYVSGGAMKSNVAAGSRTVKLRLIRQGSSDTADFYRGWVAAIAI